eukprot:254689_1
MSETTVTQNDSLIEMNAAGGVATDKLPLLSVKKSKTTCTTTQWIFIMIAAILITNIASNMDRIINELSSSSTTNSYDNEYDIVIIGAGLTGLLHSHLLSTESDTIYKTLTVERFNRVCGRTHSSLVKYNGSSITFENGAMRFRYNSLHQKLLKRLNLCENFVPLMDTAETKPNVNFIYRNNHMLLKDINATNYWQTIFNLDGKEKQWLQMGYNPVREIGYTEILMENNNGIPPITDNEWNEFWNNWTLRGILVKDWSTYAFYKVILNASAEYYKYIERNGDRDDRSIAEDFEYYYKELNLNETDPIGTFTLNIGYDQVCKRLHENISRYEENEFWFENNVIGVNYNSDDNKNNFKYVVNIQNVHKHNETKKVYTNNVISTIPPYQLQHLLSYIEPIDTYNTRIMVDSVNQEPRYKITMIYDSTFWIENNLTTMTIQTSTDMEISGLMIENAWTNNTLTAFHFYTGSAAGELWHRLQMLGDSYPIKEGMEFDNLKGLLLSSTILVDEIMKQLKRYFMISDIPYPLASFSSPLGYNVSRNDGFYNWKAGTVPNNVINNIIKPIDNENIFIVSSSYSISPAWQYGCIYAALQNLDENFNIHNPIQNDDECQWPNI